MVFASSMVALRAPDALVAVAAILVLVACRPLSSARLFQVATAVFAWTAVSLFFELPARGGLAARLGWYGILIGGPLAIALAMLALSRYSREHGLKERRGRQ